MYINDGKREIKKSVRRFFYFLDQAVVGRLSTLYQFLFALTRMSSINKPRIFPESLESLKIEGSNFKTSKLSKMLSP